MEDARLLNVALNQIGGEWDADLLARLLIDLRATADRDLTLSGFAEADLQDLLTRFDQREKRARPERFDLDEALAAVDREASGIAPGAGWQLGAHRLFRGDATDAAFVAPWDRPGGGRDSMNQVSIKPGAVHDDEEDVQLRLQQPPEPPRRQYVTYALRGLGTLMSDLGLHGLPPPALMPGTPEQRRDRNSFYYKPNRSLEPADYVGLECEQWRHSADAEYFEVELSWEPGASEIKGALECSIHGENLSTPVKRVLPVRIAIDEVSAGGYVGGLIQELREALTS